MSYLWPMARTVPMITMVPMVCMFPMIPLVSDYVPCGPHIVSMVHMVPLIPSEMFEFASELLIFHVQNCFSIVVCNFNRHAACL